MYEEHGVDFPAALGGMFAIALWDRTRERLVLARDRLGKKPLHYVSLPDGSLAFASELKALLLLPGLRRELDPRALDAYLALQYVPGVETGVAGIRRLAPGHVLVWEGGGILDTTILELEPELRGSRGGRLEARSLTTVTGAVRRRLVSDVPLGALLSGGIDSTIVVGLMAQASSDPVRTFTVGVPDPALRRAEPRPHSSRGLRHGARRARGGARSRGARLSVDVLPGRTARGRGNPPDLPHLGGRTAPRHGRAHR